MSALFCHFKISVLETEQEETLKRNNLEWQALCLELIAWLEWGQSLVLGGAQVCAAQKKLPGRGERGANQLNPLM